MANTYTQLYIHIIFAVKYRQTSISKEWKNELYKYITGVTQNNKHKLISINGMSDHVQILIGMHPAQSISDLIQDIKANSSKWINEKSLLRINLNGKVDMERLHIADLNLNKLLCILKIKNSII